MNKENNLPVTKHEKKPRFFLWFFCGGLTLLISVLVWLVSIAIHETLFSTHAFEKIKDRGAVREIKALSGPTSSTSPQTVPVQTTLQLTSPSQVALKFEPLIPDASNLPDALLKARDGINHNYDEILRRIIEYESMKNRLSFEQSKKIMINVSEDVYRRVILKILETMSLPNIKELAQHGFHDEPFGYSGDIFNIGLIPRSGSMGVIREKMFQLQGWYEEARIETYARDNQFGVAANLSNWHLDLKRDEWKRRHAGYVYESDYFGNVD